MGEEEKVTEKNITGFQEESLQQEKTVQMPI